MALKSKFFLIIYLTTFISSIKVHGYNTSRLPVLVTKQSIQHLRLVTIDGKFTYYQQQSTGKLLLSTNYSVDPVLQASAGTNYRLISSPTRRKILISMNERFFDFIGFRLPKKIYEIDFGKSTPMQIGEGLFPMIHLEDHWASFYNAQSRILTFKGIINRASKFQVKLVNVVNPYFIPQRVMLSDNKVVYTDVNKEGLQGVITFERSVKKTDVLKKQTSVSTKIELCLSNGKLFIGEFGLGNQDLGSTISYYVVKKDDTLVGPQLIYKSKKNDIGNIKCQAEQDMLYFVQNQRLDSGLNRSEVVSLNLAKKYEIKTLSDLRFASQIVNMDGRLLIPYLEKYYILLGKNNLADDSFVNKKSIKK
ncbi:MAG: hypothetical protein ISR65_03745 [Bacteriovoracaceae bacterium]|nr:hypothetical protein [Bacteriovoracaceae bacterium]